MFKDIDLFNPRFVRFERENENIVFDFEEGGYFARDKERYEKLCLTDYLERVEHEKEF
jgi:hypothetical protein